MSFAFNLLRLSHKIKPQISEKLPSQFAKTILHHPGSVICPKNDLRSPSLSVWQCVPNAYEALSKSPAKSGNFLNCLLYCHRLSVFLSLTNSLKFINLGAVLVYPLETRGPSGASLNYKFCCSLLCLSLTIILFFLPVLPHS